MPFVPTSVSQEEDKLVKTHLTEEELKRCVKNAATAILILGQKQAVIKKADINKHTKTGHRYYKVNNALITYASHDLYKTFGMRLFESDDKYILVNSSIDHSKFIKHNPEAQEELTILFFIMVHIFTSPEEKSTERELTTSLATLGIPEQDLVKIFTSLVKKAYLYKYHQHEEIVYAWGPRAVAETEPLNFFDCFLELAEGKEDDWPEQKRRIETLKRIHGIHNQDRAVAGSSQRA